MPQFDHDVLFLPQIDDKNRTVIITDQKGPGPLENITRKYERDLPKALNNFKLVSSEIIRLANDRKAARIVHTNSQPGVPVRQVNYIVDLGGKYYFIAFTCMESDGAVFDQVVESFVTTITPVNGDRWRYNHEMHRSRECLTALDHAILGCFAMTCRPFS